MSPSRQNKAKTSRKRKSRRKETWLLVGLAALAVAVFLWFRPDALSHLGESGAWWSRLGRPLLRTVLMISLGLALGQLLEATGLSRRIGGLTMPLMRQAHLPPEAGTAFAAAFASGVTANTLLYTSWQEGRLGKGQLVAANLLVASLPAYFLHLPTTFFIVYGLLGRAALVYFGLTFLAVTLRFAATVLVTRLVLPAECCRAALEPPSLSGWREILKDTWQKFRSRLRRILVIVLPVYLVIFLLSQGGFFSWLGQAMAGWVSWRFLPVEAMSVIVFSVMAEFTSGFAAAAALLNSGGLGEAQVVTALLVGNMLATPVRVARHQLPHYMGIYSPKLGVLLIALGQAARVACVALVLAVYLAFNL